MTDAKILRNIFSSSETIKNYIKLPLNLYVCPTVQISID